MKTRTAESIEIVSHCYAEDLPHYAQLLCYQMSSLVLNSPENVDVMLTVCTSKSDKRTKEMLSWFRANTELKLKALLFERREMTKRAIGRNYAAQSTTADAVWFADCDQVFGDGVLDKVAKVDWADALMIYPRMIYIHRDHAMGDDYALRIDRPKLVDIAPSDFIVKVYKKAVGGAQIVKGETARELGYLKDDEKWQKPSDIRPFSRNCFDDRVYRGVIAKLGERTIQGRDLTGMYRLRHTKAGRMLE